VKPGVNAWSIMPGGADPKLVEKLFGIASEAGFAGIELCFNDGSLDPDKIDSGQRHKYVELAESYGLEIPSVATGVLWKYNLGSLDEKTREKGAEYVRKGLRLARDLGARVVLVVPAVAKPEIPYDTMYRISKETIKSLAGYAEDLGVIIGVENVWNKFLYSPLEFRRFIEEINHDYVKAYLDVGNVLNLGYPEHWIDLLKGLIAMVHVKDFDLKVGNITGFRHLGKGSMNWENVLSRLKAVGYDDFLNLECGPGCDPEMKNPVFPDDYLRYAKENAEFLKEIIGKIS